MRALILFISLYLISNLAFGQDALFNHFGKAEGLTSNEVYDISQDADNRIWVATSKGLVKLEGLSFNAIPKSTSLKGSVIVGFYNANDQLGCYTSD